MGKILVSACLLGDPVRYDGRSKALHNDEFAELINQHRIVRFCPEVEGGLPVPRDAAEIQLGDGLSVINNSASVMAKSGADVTHHFLMGAHKALELCRRHDITVAILTEFSPSCGSSQIYDGSFKRTKRQGVGVTTALLRQHGIEVFNQHQISHALVSVSSDLRKPAGSLDSISKRKII